MLVFLKIIVLATLSFVIVPGEQCAHGDQIKNEKILRKLGINEIPLLKKKSFIKFINEEICPCNSPKTLAGSIFDKKCEPARLLAKWTIEGIKKNVPLDILFSSVSDEINEGFGSSEKKIQINEKYAKGSKNATITVVEFADFECVHCKSVAIALNEFVNKNKEDVRLIFKYFPLSKRKIARNAAIAAEAAGKQGKFWEMHDELFSRQGKLNNSEIIKIAKKINLDMQKFKNDLNDSDTIKAIESSINEAAELALNSAPKIFFNSREYFLSFDAEGFELRKKMEIFRMNKEKLLHF